MPTDFASPHAVFTRLAELRHEGTKRRDEIAALRKADEEATAERGPLERVARKYLANGCAMEITIYDRGAFRHQCYVVSVFGAEIDIRPLIEPHECDPLEPSEIEAAIADPPPAPMPEDDGLSDLLGAAATFDPDDVEHCISCALESATGSLERLERTLRAATPHVARHDSGSFRPWTSVNGEMAPIKQDS